MKRGGPGGPGRAAPSPPPSPPAPLTHPAMMTALVVSFAAVLASVTYVLFETDVWQHLLVGKAIWTLGHVPTTQLWSWASYGDPEVNSAWLFRVIIWKVWSWAGVWGLQSWRWVTTLAAFAFLWATARRLGARGFAALLAPVACVLVYRLRSQIRPETLAAVYLSLQLWILENRRQARLGVPGPDRTIWLPALALLWANTHISYFLGFALLGIHWIDEQIAAWRGDSHARPLRLLVIGVISLAVSTINPFGWRALWQPFDFAIHWRNEPMFAAIGELQPLHVQALLWNGVSAVMIVWPLLMLVRAWRRRTIDVAETLTFLFFTGIAWSSVRFLGWASLVAVPYLARDIDACASMVRWPRWTASPWTRAAFAALACVALGWRVWTAPGTGIGVGFDERYVPVRAADFIAENGIRGRMFNHFHFGGYLLYRFWPERDRLPFASIHPEALRHEDRVGYEMARTDPAGWAMLDRRHHFDFAVLYRRQLGGDVVLDVLDADPNWSLVFLDDVTAIFVRRDGPLAGIAERFTYHATPAGKRAIAAFGRAAEADTALRARAEIELERQIATSHWSAMAGSVLATLNLMDGRPDAAAARLRAALAVDPTVPRAHERLGMIALVGGRPYEAAREFEAERDASQGGPLPPGLEFHLGQAYARLGDTGRARAAWRASLKHEPAHLEALDSLRAIESER